MSRAITVGRRTGGLNVLLTATGIAILGQGMALTAGPLLAAELSRDPLAVSAVTAATYAAVLLVGLPAGALVDRWPLRSVMVLTDLARFLILGVFTAFLVTGGASIWLLILVVFLVGVGNCFFDPAAQAAIPGVVGRDPQALGSANGKLWALDTFGRGLAGPPIGAVVFGVAVALPFGIQAVAFLLSALLLLRLVEPRATSPVTARGSLWTEVGDGVRFLLGHRELRMLTLGMAAFNFGYNVSFAPLVLFVQDRLELGNVGFGVLVAVAALGGVLGGWVGTKASVRLTPARVYAIALACQGLGWLTVLVGGSAVLAGVGMFFVGLVATVVSVVGGAARQRLTPDGSLARVVSATRVAGIGSAALGAVVGGAVASAMGSLGAPLAAAGAFLLVASLGFALFRHTGG